MCQYQNPMNGAESIETRTVLREAGRLLGPWLPLPEEPKTAGPPTMIRFSRRAMATHFEVVFPFGNPSAHQLAASAFESIDVLEEQLTVYRDDSEVSLLNRLAAQAPVVVEQRLFELLQLAARLHRETWGAFDATSGPLVRAWGFFHRQGRMPSPAERDEARRRVGMHQVKLDSTRRTIQFCRDGVEINLGSIGKGFALDRVAEQIQETGCRSFLLHAGGSSAVAAGEQPGQKRGWEVSLRHPWQDAASIGTVHLHDRALGTSAATYQHFEYNKRKFGHVLDPRTGRPAEGIASATAIAPTAAEADALATAFYVLGVDKTRLYCQTHHQIGAVLLPDAADATPIVFGTAEREFTPSIGCDRAGGSS